MPKGKDRKFRERKAQGKRYPEAQYTRPGLGFAALCEKIKLTEGKQ